jgi:hypothetical protein
LVCEPENPLPLVGSEVKEGGEAAFEFFIISCESSCFGKAAVVYQFSFGANVEFVCAEKPVWPKNPALDPLLCRIRFGALVGPKKILRKAVYVIVPALGTRGFTL